MTIACCIPICIWSRLLILLCVKYWIWREPIIMFPPILYFSRSFYSITSALFWYSLVILLSVPLSGYGGWKRSMCVSLSPKNKIAFIDGTYPKPPDNSLQLQQWNICNYMVVSWITSSLSPTITECVQYSEMAESIWRLLKVDMVLWIELRFLRSKINLSLPFRVHQI